MATLSDLREKTLRVLSDPTGQQYSGDLLDDGIRAALAAILPWLWKRSLEVIECDGEEVTFELPADMYRVVAVLDDTLGMYIPQNILSAHTAPGKDLVTNQDWMEYPEGYISFANPPEGDVQVHYGAVWAEPVNDDDVIEPPTWCHRAIIFYAASYALLEKSSSSANIRQWNVTVDSGTPIHNPMRDMSTYYYERFTAEMEHMPAMARGVYG
jgi:hypothetical protein